MKLLRVYFFKDTDVINKQFRGSGWGYYIIEKDRLT